MTKVWVAAALLLSIVGGWDQPVRLDLGHERAGAGVVSMHAGACLHLCEPRLPPTTRPVRSRRLEAHELLINGTRARIHHQLSQGPESLTALATELDLTTSTVLWHLGKLIGGGLVSVDRSDPRGPLYVRLPQAGPSLPEAIRLVHSVPARELVEHLLAHPGQHLGQAASAIGAPRARYWRVLPALQRMRLIKVVHQGRRHLLVATPLAEQALRASPSRGWASLRRTRTRRKGPARPRFS